MTFLTNTWKNGCPVCSFWSHHNLWKFVQNSLEFVAETDKNVTEAIKEGECSDEIGYVKDMIQMTTDKWKSNSKLDLGKKWWDWFGFLKIKIFPLETYYHAVICFGPSRNKCRGGKSLFCHECFMDQWKEPIQSRNCWSSLNTYSCSRSFLHWLPESFGTLAIKKNTILW
jgi:hypothetical protein